MVQQAMDIAGEQVASHVSQVLDEVVVTVH
jgi:hypothetical protein